MLCGALGVDREREAPKPRHAADLPLLLLSFSLAGEQDHARYVGVKIEGTLGYHLNLKKGSILIIADYMPKP